MCVCAVHTSHFELCLLIKTEEVGDDDNAANAFIAFAGNDVIISKRKFFKCVCACVCVRALHTVQVLKFAI